MNQTPSIRHLEFGGRRHWLWGLARAAWVKCLVLALLAGSLAGLGLTLWRLNHAWTQEQRLLEAGTVRIPSSASAPPLRLSSAERQRLNLAVRALNAPWAALLRQVERVLPADVTPLLIEPSMETGIVRLQLEGASTERLLATAQRFQQEPGVAAVRLGAFARADQGRGVRLSLELALQR